MRRTTFTARFGLVSIAMAGIALLAAPEAQSGSKTSVVTDPEGDAFINFNFVEPQEAPDYLDLIRGEITLQGGIFIFKFTVAGPVPDEPFVPQGRVISWDWLIDTDPATFPTGGFLPPGFSAPFDFVVSVLWDGTDFDAILTDRRPSLLGEDAIVTPIPFNIDVTSEGSLLRGELSASVSSRMLDRPRSFGWLGGTALIPSLGDNLSALLVDLLSDDGRAAWPAE